MSRLYVLAHGKHAPKINIETAQPIPVKIPAGMRLHLASEPGQTISPETAFTYVKDKGLPGKARTDTSPRLYLTPLLGSLREQAQRQVGDRHNVEILSEGTSLKQFMRDRAKQGFTELCILSCAATGSNTDRKTRDPKVEKQRKEVGRITQIAKFDSLDDAYAAWQRSNDKDDLLVWPAIAIIRAAHKVRLLPEGRSAAELWTLADLIWYSEQAAAMVTGRAEADDGLAPFIKTLKERLDDAIESYHWPSGQKDFWLAQEQRNGRISVGLTTYLMRDYNGSSGEVIRSALKKKIYLKEARDELARQRDHLKRKDFDDKVTEQIRQNKARRQQAGDAVKLGGAPLRESIIVGSENPVPLATVLTWFASQSSVVLYPYPPGQGEVIQATVEPGHWQDVLCNAVALHDRPTHLDSYNSVYEATLTFKDVRGDTQSSSRCWIGATDSVQHTEQVEGYHWLHSIFIAPVLSDAVAPVERHEDEHGDGAG
ncbi:hypothetical protein [Streptomyces sp. NBC_01264]|uniref:hypothetical protein n=1 Tax=Streptomyces sp. NBC_01264 TaxID=2903804 RepID=UPI0022514FF2|nr:hypothetical protein [Streptomyces sp. NBC_01264]MCX4781681.1 hypothetical protein [Streptomyces sp. NBC_01264]